MPARTFLQLNFFVLCDGDSGFAHRQTVTNDGTRSIIRPVITADGEGIARGISVERGLQMHDVLGRLIVLKITSEETNGRRSDTGKQEISDKAGKRRPVFGLIGCCCPPGSPA